MSDELSTPTRVRWARLRFMIVGPLLGSPPEPGELAAQIAALAARQWRHPTTDEISPLQRQDDRALVLRRRGPLRIRSSR